MKNLSLIFLSIAFPLFVISQPCPDSLFITSQLQIDNFQIIYPSCTAIEGDVIIIGDEITNLNGFSVLTSVGGKLRLFTVSALTNLDGLDNLTSIGSNLMIWNNDALTSLAGLGNVTSIGGDLDIGVNKSITTLLGLGNVTSIGGAYKLATMLP